MTFTKDTALELCALNLAAYSLAETGRCVLPAGYTPAVAIRMPAGDRPFFLKHDPLDIWGYCTSKDQKLYIVFRGTQFTSGWAFGQEWAEDALSLPLQPFGAGHVHAGFYGAYKALRMAIEEASKAVCAVGGRVITGHSLGAALATLCWADLGGDLITFASPRVGDLAFSRVLPDTFRVVNSPDIVPMVPPYPFRHGGTKITVHGPGGPLDLKRAHSLIAYESGLRLL